MSAPTSADRGPDGHLRATLSVTPSPAADCVVLGSGSGGTVSKHATPGPPDADGRDPRCRAEVTPRSDADPRLLDGEVTDGCVCPVFREHDCVTSLVGFEGHTLRVDVAVPAREELAAVVAALRERGATVRLDRLSASGGGDPGRRILELDAAAVTDKQRDAVRAAVSAGYYETPRDADLEDLADDLGVSPSAVSQRLAAVESKLVAELARVDDGATAPAD